MRANEFTKKSPEILDELAMNPNSLKQMAAQTGAQAGMEFEMIVNNLNMNDKTDYEPDYEPDYERDERTGTIDNIIDFFTTGNMAMNSDDAEKLRQDLNDAFSEWRTDQIPERWSRYGMRFFRRWMRDNNHYDSEDDFIDAVNKELADHGRDFESAYEDFSSHVEDGFNDFDWLYAAGYQSMSNIENRFDATWPHWSWSDGSNDSEIDINEIAEEYRKVIGRKVNASTGYHGGQRAPNTYVVEPDGSLSPEEDGDSGLEFVSPPLPIDEMISDLNKTVAWAKKRGCYTNESTGLHMNVSVPGYSIEKLDYVKLALFMGDEYVLQQFGRMGNSYCASALSKVRSNVKEKPGIASEVMAKMRQHLNTAASKLIHTGITSKYTSINTKDEYIEFRSPGGDWLNEDLPKLENTLLRFVVALSIAIDPEKYKQEYAKKLYKLLAPKQGDAMTEIFTRYSTGNLTKEQLKSLLDQQKAKQPDAPLPDRTQPLRQPKTEPAASPTTASGAAAPTSSAGRFEIYNPAHPEIGLRTFYARDAAHAREEFNRILTNVGADPARSRFRQI